MRWFLLAIVAFSVGCEPYRVEYRRRPAYYDRLTDGELPSEVQLDDGTRIVYHVGPTRPDISTAEVPERDSFQVRQETEEGEIVLRALLPEHVVANLLHSLRYEEYDLIWDQLLADRARQDFGEDGRAAMTAFMQDNRVEIARMLNRMRIGLATHDTVVDRKGDYIVLRFWPQTAALFRFKRVVLVREDHQLKLLAIQ